MSEQLDKKTYIGIVRFTLQFMVEFAAENNEYNPLADTLYYHEKPSNRKIFWTKMSFLNCVKKQE